MSDAFQSGSSNFWGYGSGPIMTLPNVETLMKMSVQNMGQLIKIMATNFPAQSPTESSLGIVYSSAGGTAISTTNGYLMSVNVTVATTGTVIGTIHDANSPANATSSNVLGLIPSSGTANYVYPYVNGLTVQPSSVSTQTVSVYFI